ncbi:MAG: DUF222 domain-containing protein [Geodermatophilaceae bacterium]|nr:DUF222 domain-containing protein [Geodermatophilaceae bacterium]
MDGGRVAGDESTLTSAAGAVDAILDALDRDPWGVPDADLGPLLRSWGRACDRMAAVVLGLIAEADCRDTSKRAGATSTVAWVREMLNLTPGAAAKLTRTAQGVRSELSATGAALAAGQIGYEQATAITRAVTALPADLVAEPEKEAPECDGPRRSVRQVAEAHLLGEAAFFDAGQLSRLGTDLLSLIAPEIGEAREADALARQEARDRERSELSWSPDRHGGLLLSGHLDAEGAEILRAALDPLSAPHPVDGSRDDRSAGRRRADALVELARRAMVEGDLPRQGGEAAQVVVHVPLDTLVRGLGPAAYQDGVCISPGLARKFACCATSIPAVLGADSAVLDLGRAQRLFTGARRRAVILRDRGCAFPGCDRPPAWADIHHITAWHVGGRTDGKMRSPCANTTTT